MGDWTKKKRWDAHWRRRLARGEFSLFSKGYSRKLPGKREEGEEFSDPRVHCRSSQLLDLRCQGWMQQEFSSDSSMNDETPVLQPCILGDSKAMQNDDVPFVNLVRYRESRRAMHKREADSNEKAY
ncbi:hypothetical protein VNO77_38989 [Canavalia gladiata]|uniref:Uncharacterized protein n=1 Tax=Canavalia gladiata TaxID=3824 RepID=A0AAN9PZB4_CANGL